MRIALALIVHLLLLPKGVFGQGHFEDSLHQRPAHAPPGPAGIDLLIELGMIRYGSGSDTSGLVYLREAVALSRTQRYARGLAFEPVIRAILLHQQGDHQGAIHAFKESVAMLDRSRIPQGLRMDRYVLKLFTRIELMATIAHLHVPDTQRQ